MSAALLITLDRVLVFLVAALWGGAGAYTLASRTTPRLARVAAALLAAALVATAARAAVAVSLAGHSWWFAGDKLLLALPLLLPAALTAAAITLPRLLRTPLPSTAKPPTTRTEDQPGAASAGSGTAVPGASQQRPATPVPVLSAAYAAAAGVFIAIAVGYPVSPYLATVITLAWAGATAATWSMLTRKGPPGRAWRVAGAITALSAVAWTGSSLWNAREPDILSLATQGAVDVATLRGTSTTKVRAFTLTARQATVTLPGGQTVEALTFNGTAPGPTIRVRQGETVEVTLRNTLTDRGVTLHWHGYHVPNGEDGVPGLTQDAVKAGGEFVYRFTADQPGTYWYHTHESPNLGLQRGLFGALIVDPAPPQGFDEPVALHTFDGLLTTSIGDQTVPPGTPVRLRMINTDNGPHVLGVSGVPYRIAAVDGMPVDGRELTGERAQLAAGGRYDLTFTMPERPVRVAADDGGLVLTPGSGAAPAPSAGPLLDITQYGSRQTQAPQRFDRDYTWVLDKLVTPRGGLPLLSHTVNGQVWPRVDAPLVKQGEWVRFTVVNRSGDLHPMHPHGHHVLVLSRNGSKAAPIWMDSFDVAPGEVWEVALKADNPGLWLSHCHELKHAAEGMTLHFAYEGVRSPYALGDSHGNHPE